MIGSSMAAAVKTGDEMGSICVESFMSSSKSYLDSLPRRLRR